MCCKNELEKIIKSFVLSIHLFICQFQTVTPYLVLAAESKSATTYSPVYPVGMPYFGNSYPDAEVTLVTQLLTQVGSKSLQIIVSRSIKFQVVKSCVVLQLEFQMTPVKFPDVSPRSLCESEEDRKLVIFNCI